mmetsp:Transcript_5906/g.17757  ORF Transcript_5906/g.17757 Transcript_5906/m.17757 type:complete len:131 (+) Transcript_5906:545-937(+)
MSPGHRRGEEKGEGDAAGYVHLARRLERGKFSQLCVLDDRPPIPAHACPLSAQRSAVRRSLPPLRSSFRQLLPQTSFDQVTCSRCEMSDQRGAVFKLASYSGERGRDINAVVGLCGPAGVCAHVHSARCL